MDTTTVSDGSEDDEGLPPDEVSNSRISSLPSLRRAVQRDSTASDLSTINLIIRQRMIQHIVSYDMNRVLRACVIRYRVLYGADAYNKLTGCILFYRNKNSNREQAEGPTGSTKLVA